MSQDCMVVVHHASNEYNALNASTITEALMASLTIRNLDNTVKSRLRQLAAQHDRSMEAEVRAILSQVAFASSPGRNLAASIQQRFAKFGIDSLPVPARQNVRTPPDFGEN